MSNRNKSHPEHKPHRLDGYFTCYKCKIPMHYIGEKWSKVYVCVEKYDEDGEFYTTDELRSLPYDIWKCPQCGHRESEGY